MHKKFPRSGELTDWALSEEELARRHAERDSWWENVFQLARDGDRRAQILVLEDCVDGNRDVPSDVRELLENSLLPEVWDKVGPKDKGPRGPRNSILELRLALEILYTEDLGKSVDDQLMRIADEYGMSDNRSLYRIKAKSFLMQQAHYVYETYIVPYLASVATDDDNLEAGDLKSLPDIWLKDIMDESLLWILAHPEYPADK
jgi:hypothetical protein